MATGARFAKWFADRASFALQDRIIETPDLQKVRSVYQPLGSVFTVMPWNLPFYSPIKSSVPNLLAGNTVLLKPAPSTPQTGLELQDLMEQAGLSNGEFLTLFADN